MQNLIIHIFVSVTNSTGNEDESGTSTPSLMTISLSDIFLEKLADRFGNNPNVEVRLPGGYSTNTTAPASSDTTSATGGDCSTPEVTGGQHAQTSPDTSKLVETSTKLPHDCFR